MICSYFSRWAYAGDASAENIGETLSQKCTEGDRSRLKQITCKPQDVLTENEVKGELSSVGCETEIRVCGSCTLNRSPYFCGLWNEHS